MGVPKQEYEKVRAALKDRETSIIDLQKLLKSKDEDIKLKDQEI
jgi:hypothetical protein